MEYKHKQTIAQLHDIITKTSLLEGLQNPDSENYQNRWHEFFKKYHGAIIKYILRRAGWSEKHNLKAEDVASLVYEKGFRYSFHQIPKGVRFRHVLMQLVKNCLYDYHKVLNNEKITFLDSDLLKDSQISGESLEEEHFNRELLEVIASKALEHYNDLEQYVICEIRSSGKLPSAINLAQHLNISEEAAHKRRQRSKKQWLFLWQEYKNALYEQITNLVYGDHLVSQEIETFKNL